MLQEKVLNTIKKYNLIQKGDKIVVGVSGGPDSMCLLDCLYCLKDELNIELCVAHVNHMIRQEAEEETKYVQDFCTKLDIPCFVKYVDVTKIAKEQKLGTEEIGRKVRYEFFEEVAKKTTANKIATAHTANDNAETVLMNLLRGSGIAGLNGIKIKYHKYLENTNREASNKHNKQKIEDNTLCYIRPLRKCERIEIETYCNERNLEPKIDKTNFENIYTRNKIRNELIPYLQKEFNPNIIQGLNRLSDLAKEEDEYFGQIVQEVYETTKIGENENEIVLDLKEFNELPKVIKGKLILYTINKVTGTTQGIEKINIEDIIKLCQNNVGNKYLTPNKNIKIFIKKGEIYIFSL